MADLHPQKDLAPRDIVARAVYQCKLQYGSCLLDATNLSANNRDQLVFKDLFPTVWESCQKVGIDPNQAYIPVAPALHYHMGGIAVSPQGRTSLGNLWACGEVSATGLHGANRLASNSLLEAIVYGCHIAEDIKSILSDPQEIDIKQLEHIQLSPLSDKQLSKIRSCLYQGAGLVRDAETIQEQLSILAEIDSPHTTVNLVQAILQTALNRRESRGAHFRSDIPTPSDIAQSQFVQNIVPSQTISDLHFSWENP